MLDWFLQKVASKLEFENLMVGGLLLATALGSALYVYWTTTRERSWSEFFEFLWPHEIMTHPSAKADFWFWITRRIAYPFLMIPAGAVFVAAWVISRIRRSGDYSASPSRFSARRARG